MRSFRIRTHHGTLAVLDAATRTFVHAADSAEYEPAHLMASGSGPAFLLGALPATSEIEDSAALDFVVLPLRLRLGRAQHTGTLISPLSRFFCAEPAPEHASAGPFLPNRDKAGLWETFTLVEDELPPGLAATSFTRGLSDIAASHPTIAELVAEIGRRDDPVSLTVLRTYLIAVADEAEVGKLFSKNPQAAERAASPADPWLSTGLPELLTWVENRDAAPRRRKLGPDLDWLAHPHFDTRPAELGRVCLPTLRRGVKPRRGACVIATARNEGVYLPEWIAYHRAVGFQHFFIYSNDNDDGSDALLGALADNGVITWIDNKMEAPLSPQYKTYTHALSLLPEVLDYEWTLVIDVDEFFVFDTSRFLSVDDYLNWQSLSTVDAITLNWLMFGTYGAIRYRDGDLLSRRFFNRQPGVNAHIKTMCRPHKFWRSHPHNPQAASPHADVVFRNADGNPHEYLAEFALSVNPSDESAWINHYWSKSIDELLCKFSRNRGDRANEGSRPPAQIVEDIATRVLSAERGVVPVHDRRIMLCAPDLQAAIAGLLALPGVESAFSRARIGFATKIARLREAINCMDASAVSPELSEVLFLVRDETST
jgi:hypothetical protein